LHPGTPQMSDRALCPCAHDTLGGALWSILRLFGPSVIATRSALGLHSFVNPLLASQPDGWGGSSRRLSLACPLERLKGDTSEENIVSPCKYSKYPPAEPEALRLLAPQRGLFATA
jgi:hypothetical protein